MQHRVILCGVLASLPVALHAQSATDPAQAVPAVPYRSVFVDTPAGVEAGTVDWALANAQVGQFLRGHIDLLKWEAAQSKAKAARPASPRGTEARTP